MQKIPILLLIFWIFPIFSAILGRNLRNSTEYASETIENSLIDNITEIDGKSEDVEILEGSYAGNETKPRSTRRYGGGHSHHSYGGGHHYGGYHSHHIGGYGSHFHHHHSYSSYSPSYYGSYYGNYGYGGYGYGYGNYGYGYGYGYGNNYYYGGRGLFRLCANWIWGCTVTNYRAK